MQKCFCASQIHIYYSAKQFTEGRYESIFIKGYLLEYFYKDQDVRIKYHVAGTGTCPTRLQANLTSQGIKKSYNWFLNNEDFDQAASCEDVVSTTSKHVGKVASVVESTNQITRENAGKATSEYAGQVNDKYFG